MANPDQMPQLTPADEARFDVMMGGEDASRDVGTIAVSGLAEGSPAVAGSDDDRFDAMMTRDGNTPTDPEAAAVRPDAELPKDQAEIDALADEQRAAKNADLTSRYGLR